MLTNLPESDTITAIATPPGRGGIAVIRVSGPDAVLLTADIFSSNISPASRERYQVYGHVVDSDHTIDEALMCVMRGPHSYTGEDVVEIQVHGGFASAESVIGLLTSRGIRMAHPGEFTRRAFLNGRIDLAQAEGVLEIINADNHAALECAGDLLAGQFSIAIHALIESLTGSLAQIEAGIEFSEDISGSSLHSGCISSLISCITILDEMASSSRIADRVHRGITVVITGPVNAGKSSLFNALLGRKRALVHDEPGTTRDWLESSIELDRIPINLIDTAGIREAIDPVERAGVDESIKIIETADIIVVLHDTIGDRIISPGASQHIIDILGKIDIRTDTVVPDDYLAISSLTGIGLDVLRTKLSTLAHSLVEPSSSTRIVLVDRHRHEIVFARDSLLRAVSSCEHGDDELASYEIRTAISHLESILGTNISVDVLDRIFSQFCIGK